MSVCPFLCAYCRAKDWPYRSDVHAWNIIQPCDSASCLCPKLGLNSYTRQVRLTSVDILGDILRQGAFLNLCRGLCPMLLAICVSAPSVEGLLQGVAFTAEDIVSCVASTLCYRRDPSKWLGQLRTLLWPQLLSVERGRLWGPSQQRACTGGPWSKGAVQDLR